MKMEFIGDSFMDGIDTTNPFSYNGYVIGKPFNLVQLINRYGKQIIPDCLGIYHLFYNDQLVYIGMSKNIRGRLLCHLRDNDMEFQYCLWFVADMLKDNCSISDVLKIEHKMIKTFKPVLNSVHANCR